MLVGGTLVAVDGDALVDDVAVEVVLLADGFHDELLEVFAEQHEAVLVGEDDHVLGTFAVAGLIPHEGEQHGGVLRGGKGAGFLIHGCGAGEDEVDVDALERHGHEADGAHDGGAAADPVGHGEDFEPVVFGGVGFEFAADASRGGAGDGDGVFREVESGAFIGSAGFEHAVAGFGGAAGFGNDDGERGGKVRSDVGDGALDAVGIGVVKEVGLQRGAVRVDEGVGDELGAKGGAADADDEKLAELGSVLGGDFAAVDFGGEDFAVGDVVVDAGGKFGSGGEGRVAKPVVADHASFIGIGNFTSFEFFHILEGTGNERLHFGEEAVVEIHAADVEAEAEIGVTKKVLLIARPEVHHAGTQAGKGVFARICALWRDFR